VTERLSTSAGEIGLEEYRLRVGGREWSVLHSGTLIGFWEEQQFLSDARDHVPYGLALWSSSIALAHEIAERESELRAGARVIELGAGTGLPGIVAAAMGAHVTQTDRHEAAMSLCRTNGERNRAARIDYRLADWAAWNDDARYDWIIGADILYSEPAHALLRRIFETNLVPGGRVLLSDPFRSSSIRFLETLDEHGWALKMTKWTIGEGEDTRGIGVFELTPPGTPASSR
jgi:methyltransferase-like protein 23